MSRLSRTRGIFLTFRAPGRRLGIQVRMSKTQYWTLNAVGAACALLIACNAALGHHNSRTSKSVSATQAEFTNAQRMQNTAKDLATRIAQAGQKDPVLKDLLARHDFRVKLSPQTPAKPAP